MTNKCYQQMLTVIMWAHQLDNVVNCLPMLSLYFRLRRVTLRLSRVEGTTSWSSVQSGEAMATDIIMCITYFACFTVLMINSILVQSCVFLAYATSPTVQILSVPCLSSHQRYVIVKGIVANEVIATTYFCLWIARAVFPFTFGWGKLPNYRG